MTIKMKMLWSAATVFLLLPFARPSQAAPLLKLGPVSGKAGETVSVPISFDPGASAISSLQFDVTLPAGLSTGPVTGDPALTAAGKTVSAVLHDHDWRFIIFGVNQSTFAKGNLLTAQISIASATAPGTLRLPITHVVFADAKGVSIPPGKVAAGKVTVKKT